MHKSTLGSFTTEKVNHGMMCMHDIMHAFIPVFIDREGDLEYIYL